MTLPTAFRWLAKEGAPKILVEALKTHGIKEIPGKADNTEILAWARYLGLTAYMHDSIPWCGLAVAYWAARAGYTVPQNPLWALNWAKWGERVEPADASLGDVLVFTRKTATGTAGHVGLYVGHAWRQGALHYAVLGGNQSDQVNISWLPASRLRAVRRCPWKIGQPFNVRPVRLDAVGRLSSSEA